MQPDDEHLSGHRRRALQCPHRRRLPRLRALGQRLVLVIRSPFRASVPGRRPASPLRPRQHLRQEDYQDVLRAQGNQPVYGIGSAQKANVQLESGSSAGTYASIARPNEGRQAAYAQTRSTLYARSPNIRARPSIVGNWCEPQTFRGGHHRMWGTTLSRNVSRSGPALRGQAASLTWRQWPIGSGSQQLSVQIAEEEATSPASQRAKHLCTHRRQPEQQREQAIAQRPQPIEVRLK